MSFLIRVQLPDSPGTLGAVATALGTVGADILSVDVVERGSGVGDRRPGRRAAVRPAAGRADHARPRASRRRGRRRPPVRAACSTPTVSSNSSRRSPREPERRPRHLAEGVPAIVRPAGRLIVGHADTAARSAGRRSSAAPETCRLTRPAVDCRWHARRCSTARRPGCPETWQELGTELAADAARQARAGRAGGPRRAEVPAAEVARLAHLVTLARGSPHRQGLSPQLSASTTSSCTSRPSAAGRQSPRPAPS